ncbi:MAG TPA: hypothetical protein VKY81_03775 [Natronosporangium sp.]|nr:hypothetical protein [Natronosporangium sp.]
MAERSRAAAGWAVGGSILAAWLMIVLGLWSALVGIAAIAEDEVFLTTPGYTYAVDLTAWGWIHLVLGVVALAAGLALFSGAAWARAVGIILAVLVAVDYFLFLPLHPLWSVVVIALSVFIVWSLATVAPRDTGRA